MLDQLQKGESPDERSLADMIAIAFNILSHAAKRS
jgi:hypothetical protein